MTKIELQCIINTSMGYSVMTIKEIAEIANISIGTVDRVLHNRTGVNSKTREKVLKIVKETGYEANSLARDLKLRKKYNFTIIIPELFSESEYWKLVDVGIQRAINEIPNYGTTVEYALFDRENPDSFIECFTKVYKSKPDGIVLAPPSSEEFETFMELPNIPPICFIDSIIPSYSPLITIAQDPYKGGIVAAKVMKLLTGGDGDYVCIQVHPNAYNSIERSRGFKDGMIGNNFNNVFFNLTLSSQRDLDFFFKNHPGVRGVFSTSSATSIVGDYLSVKGLKDRIVLVGYDLVEKNRKALVDGKIDCIISQRPAYQGYTALHQLYNYVVLGKTSSESIDIPVDIYFKENLSSMVD